MRKTITARLFHNFQLCLRLRFAHIWADGLIPLLFYTPVYSSSWFHLPCFTFLVCFYTIRQVSNFHTLSPFHSARLLLYISYMWFNENIGHKYLPGSFISNVVLSFLWNDFFLVKYGNIGECEGFIIFAVSIPWPEKRLWLVPRFRSKSCRAVGSITCSRQLSRTEGESKGDGKSQKIFIRNAALPCLPWGFGKVTLPLCIAVFHLALVSGGRCNKSPWTWWLKITEIYSLTVWKPKLGVTGQKTRCQQGGAPSGGFGAESVPWLFQLLVAASIP